MSKVDVVLGLQWGDEGKGKVVDVLTPNYKVIARFQGGPNAGHSLVFDGDGFVLHTVPSGIFRPDSVNIIGNGVVIDPVILQDEIEAIEAKGMDITGKLLISKKAHLILPTHRMLDAASEASKGKGKIGSTLKGIGPTYMDKTGRNGLRVGDILSPAFIQRYEALKYKHFGLLSQYKFPFDITEYEVKWFQAVESMKRFTFIDSEFAVNRYLDQDGHLLQHDDGGRVHRPRCRPQPRGQGDGHLQGLLHPRGQRPVPDGTLRRHRRAPAQHRPRVRRHHRPSAPLRLAGHGRPEICRHGERRQ